MSPNHRTCTCAISWSGVRFEDAFSAIDHESRILTANFRKLARARVRACARDRDSILSLFPDNVPFHTREFTKQRERSCSNTTRSTFALENVCVSVIGSAWPRARCEGSTPIIPETSSPPVIFAARVSLACRGEARRICINNLFSCLSSGATRAVFCGNWPGEKIDRSNEARIKRTLDQSDIVGRHATRVESDKYKWKL